MLAVSRLLTWATTPKVFCTLRLCVPRRTSQKYLCYYYHMRNNSHSAPSAMAAAIKKHCTATEQGLRAVSIRLARKGRRGTTSQLLRYNSEFVVVTGNAT